MSHPTLFNPSHFEYPYGIGLLDDLHNILPEFLYDAGLFPQSPVLRLLQQRIRTLFPHEFVQNQTQYRFFQQEQRRRAAGVSTPHRQPIRQPLSRAPRTPRTPSPPPLRRTRVSVPLNSIFGSTTDSMESFMTTLLSAALVDPPYENLTSVPVVPTARQIDDATIVSRLEPPQDVVCAVCQSHDLDGPDGPDGPEGSETIWRIIRDCQHRFHRDCIDTWFEQNVQCPVCRFDIRNHGRREEGGGNVP